MQVVINGKSYRSAEGLSKSTVWNLVELLEQDYGYRRVCATETLVSLEG